MPEIWDQLKDILGGLNAELAKENAGYGGLSPRKEYLEMLITIINAILILHKKQEENNAKDKKKK